ncbi:MAG: hypothetical protein ACI8S6_004126, partial [Myxococcota bacterium]
MLSRQLALTANLTAEQLSHQQDTDLLAAIDDVPTIAAIDQAAILPVWGPAIISGTGLSAEQLRTACPPELLTDEPLLHVPPIETASGQRLTGACAPIRDSTGEITAVAAAFSGLHYEERLARQQRQARTLLLLLGSLAGLLVMVAIRLLLSPIQAISRAAARIAGGEHDLR